MAAQQRHIAQVMCDVNRRSSLSRKKPPGGGFFQGKSAQVQRIKRPIKKPMASAAPTASTGFSCTHDFEYSSASEGAALTRRASPAKRSATWLAVLASLSTVLCAASANFVTDDSAGSATLSMVLCNAALALSTPSCRGLPSVTVLVKTGGWFMAMLSKVFVAPTVPAKREPIRARATAAVVGQPSIFQPSAWADIPKRLAPSNWVAVRVDDDKAVKQFIYVVLQTLLEVFHHVDHLVICRPEFRKNDGPANGQTTSQLAISVVSVFQRCFPIRCFNTGDSYGQ